MPSIQCDNGKWKWGESGACKYDSKKQADEDNSDYRKLVGTMFSDDIELPIFDTKEEAEAYAEELGGSGYHEHIVYMPFDSHEEIIDVMNNRCIKNNNMEKRTFNIETRVDTNEDGKEMVVGHASVYDSRSNNLGGFYEYIEKGAFTQELIDKSDVRALINHDQNLILARSTSGTLKLNADDKGLKYEFEMPETSYGKDLAISMKRGDVSSSSFAFTVAQDEWSTDEDGNDIRTIKKIDRLYDVSPVTYPAYSQAESDLVVAQRGLAQYKETLKKVDVIEEVKEEKDLVSRSLAKLKIELKKRK